MQSPQYLLGMRQKSLTRALREPDARERLYSIVAEPMDNTPEEFAAYIAAEMAKWAKVVKTAGIRAD